MHFILLQLIIYLNKQLILLQPNTTSFLNYFQVTKKFFSLFLTLPQAKLFLPNNQQ